MDITPPPPPSGMEASEFASHPRSPKTHTLELDENRDAKRAKLEPDVGGDHVSPSHASTRHTPIPDHPTPAHDDADAEGEAEIESEPEDHHEDGTYQPEEAGVGAEPHRAPTEEKPKKGEKKKRVRTDRDRERDRERRREKARERERERAAAKAAAEEKERGRDRERERERPESSSRNSKRPDRPSEESDEVYCVCKGANDEEGGTMVGCETCDNWFHPACVGIAEDQVDMLDVYICASCEANTNRCTTYRRVCKNGCGRAARSTSKFCSSRCAFTHARGILASVDKKDTKALEAALSAYPSPAPSVTIERPSPTSAVLANGDSGKREEETVKAEAEKRQEVEVAQDEATLALLSLLRRQSADAERALSVLARRQAILGNAVALWESLVPAGAATEEPKKRVKNKKRDGVQDSRPCGFDPRIVWSDAEVESWDGTEREVEDVKMEWETPEGEGGEETKKEGALDKAARLGLCAVGRRCERHQGWQKTTAVALEVEVTQLTRRRDELATLGDRIEMTARTTVAARQARDGVHAALAIKGNKQ